MGSSYNGGPMICIERYKGLASSPHHHIDTPMKQTIAESVPGPSSIELSLIARAFAPQLASRDIRALLEYLNGLTDHRFTGVYRFEPGWVVSVALWDRENPSLLLGSDVKMKESYCWLTALSDTAYIIEDAPSDPRLNGHAAQAEVRSYASVVLRDKSRDPWGTLCHFDFSSRSVAPETLERLEHFRPLVEEMLVRDASAHWDPNAMSAVRATAIS